MGRKVHQEGLLSNAADHRPTPEKISQATRLVESYPCQRRNVAVSPGSDARAKAIAHDAGQEHDGHEDVDRVGGAHGNATIAREDKGAARQAG